MFSKRNEKDIGLDVLTVSGWALRLDLIQMDVTFKVIL